MEAESKKEEYNNNLNEDDSTQKLRPEDSSKNPQKESKKQCLLSQTEHNNNYKPCTKHKTVNAEDVELITREPYIRTGYRLPNQPWRYYCASVCWMHNESVNVWTHLIGCILLVVHAIVLGMRLDNFRDARAGLMVAFVVTCVFSNLFSSLAHLLHAKSAKHYYLLYFLDYAGICIYNFGNGINSLYSCSTPEEYFAVKLFFLPVLAVVCYISFVAILLARLKFQGTKLERRRKVVMTVIYVALVGVIAWPIISRYVRCIANADCKLSSLNHLTIVFVFYALDAISFTALLPEKLRPGKFDIWGHSHQWFHVLVIATQQLQLYALHVDYVARDRARHVTTALSSILVVLGLLMVTQVVTVRLMTPAIKKKVDEMSGIEVGSEHWDREEMVEVVTDGPAVADTENNEDRSET
ncbi:hypothetical protein ACOMHN_004135 [Nucella lapillus]